MEKDDYIKKIDNAERRYFANPVIRQEGEEGVIEGVAAVVESRTDLGWFEEEIAKGAFDDVMQDDVRALFNHDPNFILGRTKSGTLELRLDDGGNLVYKYTTPDITYARDLEKSIERGDVDSSSFAFRIKEQSWQYNEPDARDVRRIIKFERLYDVSPVTYPAYKDTSVAKRSYESSKPKEESKIDLYKKKLKLIKH
jgi:HK97 family phage prohead protease